MAFVQPKTKLPVVPTASRDDLIAKLAQQQAQGLQDPVKTYQAPKQPDQVIGDSPIDTLTSAYQGFQGGQQEGKPMDLAKGAGGMIDALLQQKAFEDQSKQQNAQQEQAYQGSSDAIYKRASDLQASGDVGGARALMDYANKQLGIEQGKTQGSLAQEAQRKEAISKLLGEDEKNKIERDKLLNAQQIEKYSQGAQSQRAIQSQIASMKEYLMKNEGMTPEDAAQVAPQMVLNKPVAPTEKRGWLWKDTKVKADSKGEVDTMRANTNKKNNAQANNRN